MLDLLKKILENSNIITIIGFLTTIILAFITSFLTIKSNQKRTISEYFKKEGIKSQERLLEFWSGLLIYDLDTNVNNYIKSANLKGNYNTQDIIKIIQKESILYSSKTTIKSIGTYQQFTYKNTKINKKSDYNTMLTMIIPLRVAKKMKYDFTGEKLSEIDLLKIRINDLNFKKIMLARYCIITSFVKENILTIIAPLIFIIAIFLIFT